MTNRIISLVPRIFPKKGDTRPIQIHWELQVFLSVQWCTHLATKVVYKQVILFVISSKSKSNIRNSKCSTRAQYILQRNELKH